MLWDRVVWHSSAGGVVAGDMCGVCSDMCTTVFYVFANLSVLYMWCSAVIW